MNAELLLKNVKTSLESPCSIIEFKRSDKYVLREKSIEINGILKTCKAGQFRLESSELMVISDGKIIWRYSKANNQVIIENATTIGLEIDPLQILEKYEREFEPSVVESEWVIDKDCWSILFENQKPESQKKTVKIWVDKDTFYPLKILFEDRDGNSISYLITEIHLKKSISPKTFHFDPDDKTEIFDQRSNDK